MNKITIPIVIMAIYYYLGSSNNIKSIVNALNKIDVQTFDGKQFDGKQFDVKQFDGKQFDGKTIESKPRPWDIIVIDESFFDDVIQKGTLGMGESYMKGKWNCEKLDILFEKILWGKLNEKIKFGNIMDLIKISASNLFNQQTRSRSYDVERIHYDIGNDIYENMLGKTMAYSCGYWKDMTELNIENLNTAQENKFKLICDKLKLTKDCEVLDIGSGFGGLARYITENYGCRVTGVNISKEQLKYARNLCSEFDKIEFIDCDYRDIPEKKYDRIVSVGFFEHVGYSNYQTLFEKINRLLKDEGIFLLHTIGSNRSAKRGDPWVTTYIFPNSMLPSIQQIGAATESSSLIMEDWHNFGPDYEKTLLTWNINYKKAVSDGKIKKSDEFNRMWEYYLLQFAASFRTRTIQLWQIVFSKRRKDLYLTAR